MELKVVCNCGQKYKFDVEPVHGRMPFAVSCPACGTDGTPIANGLLDQMPQPAVATAVAAPIPVATMAAPAPVAAPAMAAPPPPAPAPGGLRINRAAAPPPPAPPIPVAAAPAGKAPRPAAVPRYMQTDATTKYNNFFLGIIGALIGAMVGVGLMAAFIMFTHFRFPALGTVEGALIGFGARLFYRGTSSTLGAMCAVVAFFTIIGTYLLFFNIIIILLSGVMSLLIGVAIAFKVAS